MYLIRDSCVTELPEADAVMKDGCKLLLGNVDVTVVLSTPFTYNSELEDDSVIFVLNQSVVCANPVSVNVDELELFIV